MTSQSMNRTSKFVQQRLCNAKFIIFNIQSTVEGGMSGLKFIPAKGAMVVVLSFLESQPVHAIQVCLDMKY